MKPTTSGNNNAKRLRLILVISVVLVIFITYSLSGAIDISPSALPFFRNVINVNKSFYKDLRKQLTTNTEINITTDLIMEELTDADSKSNKDSYADLESEQPLSEIDKEKQSSRTENKFGSENVKGFNTTISEKYPGKDVKYTLETGDVTNNTNEYSYKDSNEIPKRDITNLKLDLLKWKKINKLTNSRESKKTEIGTKRKPSKLDFRDAFRDGSQFNKSVYDIMSMKSIHFDKAFKNPCWRGEGTNGLINDGKLHCLPYFYLIGVKKSGTTDFMSKIRKHPEYCAPLFGKESQWLSRRRFGIHVSNRDSFLQRRYDIRKPEFFSALFDTAARCILRQRSKSGRNTLFYKKISAEASPSAFHMHTKWEMLPGNENLSEPRYTNFHYIKHLTPNAKIIVLFRDPVSRLYSDFLFTTRGKYGDHSPGVFHKEVLTSVEAYNRCFRHASTRSCVYNNTLKEELKQKGVSFHLSFNAGFYAVFMKDVLSVFENNQILPIYMTEYTSMMEETLTKTFSFLDMAEVSKQTMTKMLTSRTLNVAGKKKSAPMLSRTWDILTTFYKPYNEQMAALMNDSRYLFLQH